MEWYLKSLADTKYCPLWHDQNTRPNPNPSLTGENKCQLLIVGGGFTGLWAALQAKERVPDLDIILIESTFIADGASGRTGGILEADLAHGDFNSDNHFSNEAARIDELGCNNFDEFIDSLEKYNIDARFENVGHMQVATREHHLTPLRKRYEVNKKAGSNVIWYDQEDVRKKINSPTYLAGVHYKDRCGIIDPARLCWGLKKTILALGVKIFEKTPLIKIAPQGAGMKAICPDGNISCEKILMATNAFRNPLSQIRKSIIPVWDYQIATEPLNKTQLNSVGWKDRHSMADRDNMFHYYRLTHDNRITWGGGGSVCYYYGSRIDQGVADPEIRFERLSKAFFNTFPQLEGIRFTHRWSGIIASSTRFCMVPGVAFDGRVSWAVGYTGLGVGASRFGARVGLELLGYLPSDILNMQFIQKKTMNWPPEPFRWFGVTMSRHGMSKADVNNGKRGLWLKLMDRLNLGFAC
jgi:glycine/D-amino acid oxidase-like deaminating enzyme